jgi:hypothetical protein
MNPKLNSLKNANGFEEIHDEIWVIHNFTNKNERDFYIKLAESAEENEWWQREPGWWNGKFLPVPKDSDVPLQIVKKIQLLIEDHENWTWGTPSSVHRIKPGEKMFLHADNPNEKSGLNNWVDLSFVLYHNEFNGGEIIYPELGVEYHPLPGDLLMHPGSQNYLHGTKEVLPGPNRYNSTMWAYDNRAKKLHEDGLVYEGYKTKNQLLSIYNGEKPNDIFSNGEREPGNNI